MKTLFAIQKKVNKTIKYITDEDKHGLKDYWQTAKETLKLKTGDCEDLAILIIRYAKKYLNIKCNMLILKHKKTHDYHAIVTYENKWVDSTSIKIMDRYEWEVIKSINYYYIPLELLFRNILFKILRWFR